MAIRLVRPTFVINVSLKLKFSECSDAQVQRSLLSASKPIRVTPFVKEHFINE